MAKRASLSGNITRPDAEKAAKIARDLAQPASDSTGAHQADIEYETVSYNLPLDLIDLYRDLAEERHRIDQAAKRELRRQIRAAKRAGIAPPQESPPQARRSASALVREAMEAYRGAVEAELAELRK